MERTGKTLDGYLKLYNEQELKYLARSMPSDYYPQTVANTWLISFQAVQKEAKAGAELLYLAAYLAPDAIPYSYLAKVSDVLPEPLASVLADESDRVEALAALRHYSFVEGDEESFSIHRLVQAVTRDNLPLEEQKKWSEVSVQLIDKLFPEDHRTNVESWPEAWCSA